MGEPATIQYHSSSNNRDVGTLETFGPSLPRTSRLRMWGPLGTCVERRGQCLRVLLYLGRQPSMGGLVVPHESRVSVVQYRLPPGARAEPSHAGDEE
jgi:hypothetical protein